MRAGGVQEFPLLLREYLGDGSQLGFFGTYPFRGLSAHIVSVHSTPLEVIPNQGMTVTHTHYPPGLTAGFAFVITADPGIIPPVNNTPISNVSEFQIGRLKMDVGPPIVVDNGISAWPEETLLLQLDLGIPGYGSLVYQPILDSPTSGVGLSLTPTGMEIKVEFEQDDTQLLVADGEQMIIDSPFTNVGIMRAVNGGELVLAADAVNFGTIEALDGSTVVLQQGYGIRQIDDNNTAATFDDTLTGGVFRVVNGVLNVAPPGFLLSNIAGTLEISGMQAETNLFHAASSSPGNLSTGGGGINITDSGRLRLDQGVKLNLWNIHLTGQMEVLGGAEISATIGIFGPGTFSGDGTVSSGFLNVPRVVIGRESGQAGSLHVNEEIMFNVGSSLSIDILDEESFDTLTVGNRLFIQTGEVHGATLRIHVAAGFTPGIGQTFLIATANEIDGNFDIVCDNHPVVDFVPVVDSAAGTLTLEVVPASEAFHLFRVENGLATDGSEDFEDRSGNGIPNILHHAFGLGNPSSSQIDQSRLPSITRHSENGAMDFQYIQPVGASSGVRIRVLISENLTNWHAPADLGLDHLPVSRTVATLGATGYERVNETYAIPESGKSRFYKLHVDRPVCQ